MIHAETGVQRVRNTRVIVINIEWLPELVCFIRINPSCNQNYRGKSKLL